VVKPWFLVALSVLLGSATLIHGGAVNYTQTMYGGNGVLDGTSFTDATVVVTLVGDTSNITTVTFGGTTDYAIPVSATVYVQGVGKDTLTDSPMYLVVGTASGFGVFDSGLAVTLDEGPGGIGWSYPPNGCVTTVLCYGYGVFGTGNSALATYHLTAPFGPVSGAGVASTVSQVAEDCVPYTSGPECAYYPTSSGSFYWTASPTTSTFAATPLPAFFAGQVFLGSSVYYLQFPNGNLFGYYNLTNFPIFYHYDMGFEAFIDGGSGAAYMYDFSSGHWWYTSSSLFPYLYDFTLNNWLYYFPATNNPGHYTTNPRSFSDLTTGKIIFM
jgi:hypothetical protein